MRWNIVAALLVACFAFGCASVSTLALADSADSQIVIPIDGQTDRCTVAGDFSEYTPGPQMCTPRSQCCKVCRKGQACGNSCISRAKNCRKGRGCACNSYELCR